MKFLVEVVNNELEETQALVSPDYCIISYCMRGVKVCSGSESDSGIAGATWPVSDEA